MTLHSVVLVSVEEPFRPVEAEGRVTLAVAFGGSVIGEVTVDAHGVLSAEEQRDAVESALGERIWRERLAADFTRAARGGFPPPASAPAPAVSVVVSDPSPALRDSLDALDPAPDELIVADRERGAAQASGDVLAFVEGRLAVDPGWLAGLDRAFEDPLVMSVNGYVGPSGRSTVEADVVDRFSFREARFGEGNLFVRREALERVGLLPEPELRRNLVKAGWRVAFSPAHVAWRIPPLGSARVAKPAAAPASSRPAPSTVRAEDPPMSVAIASHNRRERLTEVLRALAEQTYPPERCEVVVVLDGSSDGSGERVRSLTVPYELKLIEQPNRGLAATRNRGLAESSAPVVVFLDDDIVPEREFLAEHAAAHRDAGASVVALGACPPANPGADMASLAVRHWWEDYYRRRSEPDHQWNYTDFGDGNVSIPRSVLEQSGGWDEEFARETVRRQDWELGIRLLKSGVRFVDRPRARGWHHFDHVDLPTALRYRRVEGRADVVLGRKHPEVRGHLFMWMWLHGDSPESVGDYGFLADHRRASERSISAAARMVGLVGAVQPKLAWKATVRLLGYSYLLGVREELPSEAEFRAFVEPVFTGASVTRAQVPLDRPGRLDLPPTVGPVELELTYAGRALARVDALTPEKQWDWDTVTERVVSEALAPYRAAVAAEGRGVFPEQVAAAANVR